MRLNRVATAVAAVSAGLTAAAVVRSRTTAHRRPVLPAVRAAAVPTTPTPAIPPAAAPTPAALPAATPAAATSAAAAPPARPDPAPETGLPASEQLPVETAAGPVGARDAVVLAFVRPGSAQPAASEPAAEEPAAGDPVTAQPAPPVRCGDTGGLTKAGAPCAARAGAGGRCRHHPAAA